MQGRENESAVLPVKCCMLLLQLEILRNTVTIYTEAENIRKMKHE